MLPRLIRCLILLNLMLLGWQTGGAAETPDASASPKQLTIRQMKAESNADPFHEMPVRTEGVVTWIDKTAGKQFYLQDDTGGIGITFEGNQWPEIGDLIDLQGTLIRGAFFPSIVQGTFVLKQKDAIPPPAKGATGIGLLNGGYSGERVTVEGNIRAAKMIDDTTLMAIINQGGIRVTVRISNARGMVPEDLIANLVKVAGVATPMQALGNLRQFVEVQVLASSPNDLRVLSRDPRDPWKGPVVSLNGLFKYRPGQTREHRIRIQAKVIHRKNEIVYLNDGTGAVAMRVPDDTTIRRGDWIEAVGFVDLENFLPIFSDTVIKPAEAQPHPILPKKMQYEELLDGLQHANYVTVSGKLLDRMQTPGVKTDATQVLALQTPRGVFLAELESRGAPPYFPELEVGSMIQVSGISLVDIDTAGNATGFKILVPDTEKITILQPASFFTVKRLLILLSLALGVLLAAAIYAYFSARRNTRLLADIAERRAVTAERSRLAHDLHDTLEQGLTGINLHLHGIGPSTDEASPESQERLSAARSLVQQCHAEMRQSIWNLRSTALEQFDLGEALKRTANSLVLGSNIEVELHQQRYSNVKIPPLIEDNLLRIGQEALTNAVKHAKASHLRIEVHTTPGNATLIISDNGRGVNETPTLPGHFGLVGMQERATRIGGVLKITSLSESGFSVRVDVPLPSHSS